MRWTVLADNRKNDPVMEIEHGLSILLETECHRILLDTGASDMFIRNAERLGRDLSGVDYVFISHGHSDHAGGLKHLMAVNDKAKIIVSTDAIDGNFFSKRGHQHSITTAWPDIPEERLLMISKTGEIADGIHVIAHIPQVHPIPKGNQTYLQKQVTGVLCLTTSVMNWRFMRTDFYLLAVLIVVWRIFWLLVLFLSISL